MGYYSIGKFAKIIGKTPQTLRAWHKNGNITAGDKCASTAINVGYAKGVVVSCFSHLDIVPFCKILISIKQKVSTFYGANLSFFA